MSAGKLAVIAKSARIVPTRIAFVDIAGLVRGSPRAKSWQSVPRASAKSTHCSCAALLRDGDVTHVEGRIDPVSTPGRSKPSCAAALESLERRMTAREEGQRRREGAKLQLALMTKRSRYCKTGSPRATPC